MAVNGKRKRATPKAVTPESLWGTGTPFKQMLLNDAARILRAFVNDDLDAMPWDDARDWLKSYATITRGKG